MVSFLPRPIRLMLWGWWLSSLCACYSVDLQLKRPPLYPVPPSIDELYVSEVTVEPGQDGRDLIPYVTDRSTRRLTENGRFKPAPDRKPSPSRASLHLHVQRSRVTDSIGCHPEQVNKDAQDRHGVETRPEKVREVCEAERKASLEVRYELVQTSNGLVLARADHDLALESRRRGDSEKEAARGLTDAEELLHACADGVLEAIVQDIAPVAVSARRRLYRGFSPSMKEAREAVRRGDWGRAAQLWEETAQGQDRVEAGRAYYNLGISYERLDELSLARNAFQRSIDRIGSSWAREGLQRIEARERELRRLRSAH